MPDYIKLTEPGSSHTFIPTQITVDTKGKWPDLHFLTERNEIVVVPKGAADRQLPHLKVTDWQLLIGVPLTVSRSAKVGDNGKPFWDVSAAAGGYVPGKPAASPAKAPAPAPSGPPAADPDDPGPFGPDGESAAPAGVAGDVPDKAVAKRKALEDAYLALYGRCAVAQVALGTEGGFPVDGSSINAMASTIFIAWNNRGVSP